MSHCHVFFYEDDGAGVSKLTSGVKLNSAATVASSDYAFPVDDDDHCETALTAHEDVAPVLRWIRQQHGKRTQSSSNRPPFTVYDPYFCKGGVRSNLQRLGFDHVVNRNADFYADVAAGTVPPFDVLVSNPPYSGDHMERFFRYLAGLQRPWLALVPNFVYLKDWFVAQFGRTGSGLFFIAPHTRYRYTREASSSTNRTAPFVSMWICSVPGWPQSPGPGPFSLDVARVRFMPSLRQLPKELMADGDPRRKRKRKNQRDAEKRRKLTAGAGGAAVQKPPPAQVQQDEMASVNQKKQKKKNKKKKKKQ